MKRNKYLSGDNDIDGVIEPTVRSKITIRYRTILDGQVTVSGESGIVGLVECIEGPTAISDINSTLRRKEDTDVVSSSSAREIRGAREYYLNLSNPTTKG
jgi:hypothetical protein